jgi:glutamate synthase (NADPH/NADH) small chain
MIDADAIIPAISQDVNLTTTEGIDLNLTRWKTFIVDNDTMQTNIDWVFAGGDAVLGPQTAAKAVYQGKVAAESIHRFMEGRNLKEGR